MSPRSPEDRREDDRQNKVLHVVHNPTNEAPAPKEPVAPLPAAAASPAKPDETEVELDRVAIYFKGPTAFSA